MSGKMIFATPADILARTLVGEARGEGKAGMEAVACTIMNRARKGGWWGNSVKDVCLKPWQYSCWNEGDPNLQIIINLTDQFAIYRDALEIAERAVSGELKEFTRGATHYFVKSMPNPPLWAKGLKPCFVLGNHAFYNNVP